MHAHARAVGCLSCASLGCRAHGTGACRVESPEPAPAAQPILGRAARCSGPPPRSAFGLCPRTPERKSNPLVHARIAAACRLGAGSCWGVPRLFLGGPGRRSGTGASSRRATNSSVGVLTARWAAGLRLSLHSSSRLQTLNRFPPLRRHSTLPPRRISLGLPHDGHHP